jgi:hypothetical protein
MKNTSGISAAAVLAILVVAAPASGQMNARHLVRFGFGGGISVPTSRAADALENGINGQAYVLLDPGFGFPFRFNLGYQKFDFDRSGLDPLASSGESEILSGVAGLTMNLLQLGPVRPYVTAGLGAFNMKDAITTGGTTTTDSNLRFGIDGGAGFTVRLGRLDAFIEGRVQNVYTEAGVIDAKSIRTVPVTFGILF